jgi:hypothetical protein
MDVVFSRPFIITLAILGAIAATAATLLSARLGPVRTKQLNAAGYAFMGISMLLFILAGFRG